MKALVTGVAGFIGSSLADRLLAEGNTVVGIDSFEEYYARETKEANLAQARRSPRFRLIEANILDLAASTAEKVPVGTNLPSLLELVSDADIVYHLAAQPGVRGSWGSSFHTYADNNILATQLILEASKESGLDHFIYASSSSVYGDTDTLPMREDALCRPFSPYGVTKYAAENLCQLYHRNFGVPTVSLRFFTVYGPRQRPDMAFHRFMRAMIAGRPIQVFGSGAQTRDFTFISDIVDGLMAAQSAPAGTILNLGGGSRVTLSDALHVLAEATGLTPQVEFAPEQAGDVRDTWASVDKARAEIGYQPQVQLRAGLLAEWEWLTARGDQSA